MSLAQVWTEYVTALSVNRILTIELNCEKTTSNFKLISSHENYSDFYISPTLGLNITKITSKKSHSSRVFQQYQEFASISLKHLVLILLNFLWQNCSIFNNSCTIALNTTKLPQYTPTHQGLPNGDKSIVAIVLWQNRGPRPLFWEISTSQKKQINYLP